MMRPIIELRGVSAGYRGRAVIKNIDLSIERGRIYAVIGPNGCGKTTLLRVIGRGLRPSEGKVLLDGADIFRMNTRAVARRMAILSQFSGTASDVTVRQLVSLGRYAHRAWWQGSTAEDRETVEWAIRRTMLEGYGDRRLGTLSGGERQRAWIAMSLAQKPEILLLDEPTTYLDISHQLEIMELVSALNREEGITVVMVLHDINHAARYADRLVVVNDGGIYRSGDPWEVLESGVLSDAFHVRAEIVRDAETERPILYIRGRSE